MNCGWHTYTVNAEGKYVLKTTAGSTGDLGLTSLAGATASIQEYGSGVTPTGKYANNKTIYLVVDEDGDCTVFNGYKNMVNVTVSALPNATETEGLVVDALLNKDATDFASVVFVGPANGSTDITAKGAKSNRGTLLYVYREAYGVSADANSVQYATQSYVLNNGVKDTITVDYATVGYLTTGLWTDIKYDATTGYIVDATKVAVDATIAADGTDEFVQYTTTAGEQIEYVDGILACATVNLPFAEEVEVIMIEKATGNATYSAASMNKVVKEANDITAGGVVFTGVLDADGEVIETLYVAIP